MFNTRLMLGVHACEKWLLLYVGIALLAACDRRPEGFIDNTAPGMPAAKVREIFGEPDAQYSDPKPWLERTEPSMCPQTDTIKLAWHYKGQKGDAVIFFDAENRLACLKEGGIYRDDVHF